MFITGEVDLEKCGQFRLCLFLLLLGVLFLAESFSLITF